MPGGKRIWTPPSGNRLLGAVAGGLFAGLVLSVWMLIGEVASGQPSQLTDMERQIAGWFGAGAAGPGITMAEEYLGNGGHLLLSALAGAAYALVWRRDRPVVLNGLVFGLAFLVAAHGIVGPLTGLTPMLWDRPFTFFWMGGLINGFFGLCTAFFARQFDPASVREKASYP